VVAGQCGLPSVDAERCALAPGSASLVLEVRIAEDIPDEGYLLYPCFRESGDVDAEMAAWVRFVTKHRARLQKAVDRAPDSLEGRRAAAVLSQL